MQVYHLIKEVVFIEMSNAGIVYGLLSLFGASQQKKNKLGGLSYRMKVLNVCVSTQLCNKNEFPYGFTLWKLVNAKDILGNE